MSVVSVRFHSEALGKQTTFNVIHPDSGDGPFPVLMQLHGYSDDSFSWLYNSSLVRHVANVPLIVVLPDGGTSRYLNLPFHQRFGLQRYEDLLVRDIPTQMERMFQVCSGPWAIGGLSMGGQGALRIGMKHSDRFASIWAHSAGMLKLDPDWLAVLQDKDDASSCRQIGLNVALTGARRCQRSASIVAWTTSRSMVTGNSTIIWTRSACPTPLLSIRVRIRGTTGMSMCRKR
ncbi:MAG: alpha/beta hydrolase [Thermomicrobiales bacterium]